MMPDEAMTNSGPHGPFLPWICCDPDVDQITIRMIPPGTAEAELGLKMAEEWPNRRNTSSTNDLSKFYRDLASTAPVRP